MKIIPKTNSLNSVRKKIEINFRKQLIKHEKNLSKNKGLNMFLVPIIIPTFHFSPSKIFLQLLVPIKFLITTFGPYF